MTPLKLVKVVWHDAEDQKSTWSNAEEIEAFSNESMEVLSIGWEVKRTKLYLTIAGDMANDGTFGRVCKVPLGMIDREEEVSP